MWRIEVRDTCIASGSCTAIAPRHFVAGAGNRSTPIRSTVKPDEAVLDAALSCPMEAIVIVDAETGDPVEP